MGRSLFGALHRRHGRRLAGGERKRRADLHRERLRGVMPIDLIGAPRPTPGAAPGSVAVVGGGFAGSVAAYTLDLLGFHVTLFDGGKGGRVSTSSTVVHNRLLETGGELIGTNHPLWLHLAGRFRLEMSVVSTDDSFAAQGLEMPLTLGGRSLSTPEQAALYDQMNAIMGMWCAQAAAVKHPWHPWTTPRAAALDAQSLAQQMPAGCPPDVYDAINTTFLFNNTQPLQGQSWLANLAQFAAGTIVVGAPGDTTGFFDDTEVFRCASGNQSLLPHLRRGIRLVASNVADLDTTSGKVALTLADGGGSGSGGTFDYAVFAGPLSVFPHTTVDGGRPFPWGAIQWGSACKYLAPLDRRFWIADRLAPSGMSDQAGMTWEATDNQMALPGQSGPQYCLTLFTGGPIAQQAVGQAQQGSPGFPDAFFEPLVEPMYPGFDRADAGGHFCCAPGDGVPYMMAGYSCPAPGQVTAPHASQQAYTTPHNGVVFLAGEHASPAWFGFMEGALESGFVAAVRVALAAGVDVPPSVGGLDAITWEERMETPA
ncbi:MAG TPA: FAD-dependent oxidoreductase [Longimicrobium sp.]|nr:FAD-dependent oxidoreductase [Longimicrobium sp.]